MKHSYKGRNYWKSRCSFVGNDVLSTRQSWVDRKGRQTHTAVKLSLNTSTWMTEWTPNSDYLSPHPETLLLGWWAKLLRLFDMWDGITVNFLIREGLNGVILGKPQTPKAVTDSSSSWQHCYLSSGCFLHFPLPSGQSKLRWQSHTHGVVWGELNTGAIYTDVGAGEGAQDGQHSTPRQVTLGEHCLSPRLTPWTRDRTGLRGLPGRGRDLQKGHAASPRKRNTERNQFLTTLSSVYLLRAGLPVLQT